MPAPHPFVTPATPEVPRGFWADFRKNLAQSLWVALLELTFWVVGGVLLVGGLGWAGSAVGGTWGLLVGAGAGALVLCGLWVALISWGVVESVKAYRRLK